MKSLDIYDDGASARLHNRKVMLKEYEDETLLIFQNANDGNPEELATGHKCIRGKVRETQILLSNEALEALVIAYIEYQKTKE